MADDEDLLLLAEDLRAAVGGFVRRIRPFATIPPGQASVLGYLDRTGALSIAELARLDEVRHQSMTRTVNLLADRELVVVGPVDTDRRKVAVTITDRGRRQLAEQRHTRASVIAEALRSRLDEQELAIVSRIPGILGKIPG